MNVMFKHVFTSHEEKKFSNKENDLVRRACMRVSYPSLGCDHVWPLWPLANPYLSMGGFGPRSDRPRCNKSNLAPPGPRQ